MTKNEAIAKLNEYLLYYYGIEELYAGENLLVFIEKTLKMEPPKRLRGRKDHDWNERGITYSQWISEPSEINKWEQEDDSQ